MVTNNLLGSKFIHEPRTHAFNLDHLAMVKIYFTYFLFFFKLSRSKPIFSQAFGVGVAVGIRVGVGVGAAVRLSVTSTLPSEPDRL